MEPVEPTKSPPGVDAPDTTESATPIGIKSSPPPLPVPAQAQVSTPNVENEGDATPASGSDSEAETVVLPGADGYSPSKLRKKRKIKLEDKTNENGGDINMDIDVDTDKDTHIAQVDVKAEEGQTWNEGAASLLGKRKRSKHGSAIRPDDNHTGNSSGLSSVPTSPAARSLPGPPKRTGSELVRSRSQSPSVPRKEKRHSEQVNNESGSERDKDNRRSHKRRNSNANNSGKHSKNSATDGTPQHHRTESPSPTRHNNTSAANGLSHKKKAIPAPLRTTKDHSIDYQSDASSTGESPYPRRSRTCNLGTPPTGDLAHSAKMPPHRRRPDRYGRTPLTDACEDGDYDKAKHLLAEYPEDLDQPDAARNTPLQCASLNGHEDIVKMLLQNGCNIHCKNDLGDSPLLDAVENGHLKVIKLLLGAGVDPRARNKLGEEPITKINKDDEDADAIREALLAARSTYAQARPSATSQTPQAETSDSRNRRTMSHGRSNRTGQHQLYTPLTVTTLRTAAAKGDLQTVGLVASVLEEGLDDAESLIAAAKGGHDEVLQILLAVGNANPDPSPIPGSWEFSTPILAAIGGENIKVIELLLANIDDGRFDPTRTYRGRTYYEIAKERAGPLWEEEEKVLKGAFDNYKSPARTGRSSHSSNNQPSRSYRKKPSDASDRPNASKEKHEAGDNGVDHRRDRLGSPGKKGASRSKEGGEGLDRESIPSPSRERKRSELDRTVSPSESEPAKPRRKLISGRDLKGGREKQKSSVSITSPPGATSAGADDDKLNAAGRKKNLQRSDSKAASDSATERSRSAKREKSTDRMSATSAQSPAKRPRTSSTPPSESQEASNKRRRLESESKGLRRSESVRGTSPNHRKPIPPRSDSSMQKPSSSKEQRPDPNRKKHQKLPGKPALSGEKSSHKEARPRPTEGVPSARSSQEADQKTAFAEESAALAKKKAQKEAREAREAIEAEREKAEREKAEREKAEREKAEREKAEREKAEREKAERQKAEREKAEQEKVKREKTEREVKIKKEEDDRIEKERAEEAKRQVEEARVAREAAEKRKREEQAKRAEEDARRAKEEAELQEQQRREKAEAQRRADEERKHRFEEQQRIQREEAERRRAAHIAEQRAERLRIMKEKEAARLARLPPLLRWFDGLAQPATPEVAVKFKLMQGVRYDTIVPEATGEPDGREQWLLNTQVALLLGEKDLQLSRYTAWERVSASLLAKQGLWRVESDMYSMVRADLRPYNPQLAANPFQSLSPTAADAMRKATMPLFLGLELFFVKVADLMFIAPSIPHLRNLQLDVQYHEALPDESWLGRLAVPAKWTHDPDCESYLGFTPGTKSYANGDLVSEAGAKTAVVGATPFPSTRVPRAGFVKMKRGDPEYEDLAKQQDLEDGEVNGQAAKEGANGYVEAEKSEGEAPKKENGAMVTNGVGANGVL
ncbi:hos4 protein [Pseudogymnoascus destructans]|uniref:Uncharacterized protein n=2 Tax=Pseudogymnoascus destructans TaxID=655981 RepID=L8G7P2_PSED2|nr:hos4 protein [Pseudogymnoascus destructans]ELR09250.1 hypothetical protein GMDG_03820 [Pseudogymnoascus destructans 20631-21]OAF58042.1 hos4 protein [Pseudogymnoascus destructans]